MKRNTEENKRQQSQWAWLDSLCSYVHHQFYMFNAKNSKANEGDERGAGGGGEGIIFMWIIALYTHPLHLPSRGHYCELQMCWVKTMAYVTFQVRDNLWGCTMHGSSVHTPNVTVTIIRYIFFLCLSQNYNHFLYQRAFNNLFPYRSTAITILIFSRWCPSSLSH